MSINTNNLYPQKNEGIFLRIPYEGLIEEEFVIEDTKEDLELLRMNNLLTNLVNNNITKNNFDQYKKDLLELINHLNSRENLYEEIEMPLNELLNYINYALFKFTTVLSIKFLLEQLNPGYKGNILQLTDNEILDEEYSNFLENEFNEMCIKKGKNPKDIFDNAIVDKNPDDKNIINQIKKFLTTLKKQAK